MPAQHHPAFSEFSPYIGEIPNGHEYDFLGTITRPEFLARDGSGEMVPVTTVYPYPDDEYFEWIDLLESVALAGPEYTMVELGAGFGRWAVRAAFAAIQRKKQRHIIAVEAEPTHFEWMTTHFRDNGLDPASHGLVHAAVSDRPGNIAFYVEAPHGGPPETWYGQFVVNASDDIGELEDRKYRGLPVRRHKSGWKSVSVSGITLQELTRTCKKVDLIDMDIQGHELAVVSAGIALLNDKVKRMHIGTHSTEIEQGLRELLHAQGWSCLFDYAGGGTSETPWGTFHFQDGVQSWENPRLRQPSPGPL